ncbi:MAG: biotin/lipoyl-containing protein, partial [Candidatus Tumulicola sp.]
MSRTIDVSVPDIGDFKEVPVVEVLVKPGQSISKEAPLVVLESEKASMEVPSTASGTVRDVKVRVGDKVSQGTVLLTIAANGDASAARDEKPAASPAPAPPESSANAGGTTIDLVVPDIGDFKDVPVVEVLVKPGQTIVKEAPLAVLESEKASMEVPASAAGTIATVSIKPGDKVSRGSVIATLQTSGDAKAETAPAASAAQSQPQTKPAQPQPSSAATPSASPEPVAAAGGVHASPAIRRFARELGVNLAGLRGSGPHGRITREDVQGFVKSALQRSEPSSGTTFAGLSPWPKVDFAQFGTIERKPLPRIKKLSGPNLHRNWLQVPH